MNVFEKSFLINDCHAGLNQVCKMSAIMNFIQEATIEQVFMQGDRDEMTELSAASGMFLLNVRIQLKRPIYYGEELFLRTYQCPVTRSKLYRKCKFYVKDELVGEASIVSMLVDLETRKLISPRLCWDFLNSYAYDDGMAFVPPKEVSRKKAEFAQTYHIEYSDADKNGHMNNVRYAELMSNILRMDQHTEKYINILQIDFVSECVIGDEVNLGKVQEENKCYIQGVDSKNRLKFKGEVYFKDIV